MQPLLYISQLLIWLNAYWLFIQHNFLFHPHLFSLCFALCWTIYQQLVSHTHHTCCWSINRSCGRCVMYGFHKVIYLASWFICMGCIVLVAFISATEGLGSYLYLEEESLSALESVLLVCLPCLPWLLVQRVYLFKIFTSPPFSCPSQDWVFPLFKVLASIKVSHELCSYHQIPTGMLLVLLTSE